MAFCEQVANWETREWLKVVETWHGCLTALLKWKGNMRCKYPKWMFGYVGMFADSFWSVICVPNMVLEGRRSEPILTLTTHTNNVLSP